MRIFDHALLATGAVVALLAGAATARIGLAPLDRAVASETGPAFDTADDSARRTVPADLPVASQAAPPAVLVPVSAPTPPAPPADDKADPARSAEDETRPPGDPEAGEDHTGDAPLDSGPSLGAKLDGRDVDGGGDAPPPVLAGPSEDAATVAPS